jgi:hypothetical protein
MTLVQKYPHLPDAEIARRVGRNPSSLSRWKEYQRAAAMARGGKEEFPHGHRGADGQVEAYLQSPEP